MKYLTAAVLALACIATTSGVSRAAGDPKAAMAKVPLCSGCHGVNGEGKEATDDQPAFPRLAGQIESYLIKATLDYKSDKRIDPVMNALIKGLSDADIANLAAYYAALK
ncbi:MAG: c-type cytochrome [Pseudomonadota bacterium]